MEQYRPLIIERPLELRGWRELVLDASIPLEHHDACPCCTSALGVLAALVGNRGQQRIRIGHCPLCGWAGYCDRPTEAWIADFYLSAWDAKNKNTAPSSAKVHGVRQNDNVRRPPRNTQTLLSLIENLPIDRERARILDIGCGYGGALAALKQIGFKNLFGVENSAHRARIASEPTNAEILCGDFVTLVRDGAFGSIQPFDLVFSSHVLEHIGDPCAFLQAIRGLQKSGGHLILSMPNQLREPVATIIFFLPHLHSFSPHALAALLTRAAYETLDTRATTDAELYVLARATNGARLSSHQKAQIDILEKCAREFGFDRIISPSKYRRLWWDRKDNTRSGQLPFCRPPLFEKLRHILQKLRSPSLGKARSVLISDAAERLTDAPIEFQFEGPVRLFYK